MAEDHIAKGDDGSGGDLDAAARRLDRALHALEDRVKAKAAAYDAQGGDLFDQDRARLAADLDAARAREKALEEVAAEASAALGRAAAEVRAALSAEQAGETGSGEAETAELQADLGEAR